jgi:autotransporter-associated beta strand protein
MRSLPQTAELHFSAPGGATILASSSSADNATLIANGGANGGQGGIISFREGATGGTSLVEVFGTGAGGDGALDISELFEGVTIGSLEGNGLVLLGANNLTIGSNNLNTNFGGIIQGTGSITKTGTGKLNFSGANTYSGGTTVTAGTLFVTNRRGSGTGAGRLQINGGKLGGTGRISGIVFVGDGGGPKAFITPGVTNGAPATLTVQKKLTFRADGTDQFGYKTNGPGADKIVARGVTIESGALLSFAPIDTGVLPIGTVFTAIDNTAPTATAGTFANLADGATVTVGGNTFQADYEGGDGNDLVLTVVQ